MANDVPKRLYLAFTCTEEDQKGESNFIFDLKHGEDIQSSWGRFSEVVFDVLKLEQNRGYGGPHTSIVCKVPIPGIKGGKFQETITAEDLHKRFWNVSDGTPMLEAFPHAEELG